MSHNPCAVVVACCGVLFTFCAPQVGHYSSCSIKAGDVQKFFKNNNLFNNKIRYDQCHFTQDQKPSEMQKM